MKSESVAFAIFITVVIIVSIGYNYYKKTYGNKIQESQSYSSQQTGIQNSQNYDSMYYGAPVPISVISTSTEQTYPGNSRNLQYVNQSSGNFPGNYYSMPNQYNIYSIEPLNNSTNLQNPQYDTPDTLDTPDILDTLDILDTPDHEINHSTPYSDPLPQYVEVDSSKLPPYRDEMMYR